MEIFWRGARGWALFSVINQHGKLTISCANDGSIIQHQVNAHASLEALQAIEVHAVALVGAPLFVCIR